MFVLIRREGQGLFTFNVVKCLQETSFVVNNNKYCKQGKENWATIVSCLCTMLSVECRVYSVQCTVYSVECTVYS